MFKKIALFISTYVLQYFLDKLTAWFSKSRHVESSGKGELEKTLQDKIKEDGWK